MYVREIDDQVLTLRVSGKLWMRSLIMSDVETKTEWSHLLGRGMAGELKGKQLKPIVSDMLTWDAWRKEHPETTVLDMPRTSDRYTRDFYRDPKMFVYGFEINGKTWALPMTALLNQPVHSFRVGERPLVAVLDKEGTAARLFEATVEGQELDFTRVDDQTMQDTQTKSQWNISSAEATEGPLKGSQLKQRVGIMSFRAAWDNLHPQSTDIEF